MGREYPVVWVVGATRSCKTALAEYGIEPMGFKLMSTGTYFRDQFGKEDTNSRDFVFALSNFAAECLSRDANCHTKKLEQFIAEAGQPCVVEGERNPNEFAKLYDPTQDMVILLKRMNMESYDTVIERGITAIERIIRWNINTGIASRASAFKATFGDNRIAGEYMGIGDNKDEIFLEGPIKDRKMDGTAVERYPWINILIGMTRKAISDYYGGKIRPPAPITLQPSAPTPVR